jgi:DNA-binding winged helix-turn-helix (wHTH) protein
VSSVVDDEADGHPPGHGIGWHGGCSHGDVMGPTTVLRFANFELDPHRRELRLGGRLVPMQPLIFDLLLHLLCRRDAIVGKDELIREVWKGVVVGDGAITQALSQVRRTLRVGADPNTLIRTLRGRGYRFVGEVRTTDGDPLVGIVNGAARPPQGPQTLAGARAWGVSHDRAQEIFEAIRPELERIPDVGATGLWICVLAVSNNGGPPD